MTWWGISGSDSLSTSHERGPSCSIFNAVLQFVKQHEVQANIPAAGPAGVMRPTMAYRVIVVVIAFFLRLSAFPLVKLSLGLPPYPGTFHVAENLTPSGESVLFKSRLRWSFHRHFFLRVQVSDHCNRGKRSLWWTPVQWESTRDLGNMGKCISFDDLFYCPAPQFGKRFGYCKYPFAVGFLTAY